MVGRDFAVVKVQLEKRRNGHVGGLADVLLEETPRPFLIPTLNDIHKYNLGPGLRSFVLTLDIVAAYQSLDWPALNMVV